MKKKKKQKKTKKKKLLKKKIEIFKILKILNKKKNF